MRAYFYATCLLGLSISVTVEAEDASIIFTKEWAARGYKAWRSTAATWRLDAALQKSAHLVDTAIWIDLSMTNISKIPAELLTYHPCIDYHFTLRGVGSGPVNYNEKGRSLFRDDVDWSGKGLLVRPGESEVTRVNLAEYFDLNSAGVYEIYITRSLSDLAMFKPSQFAHKAEELSAGPILFVITGK